MAARIAIVVLGAALGMPGCGDNAKDCGPGTAALDNLCVPTAGPPPICSAGTILDPERNACVLDPAACQAGTVLIDNACQDPTSGITVDVLEGAEPNGLGLGSEVSATPAGLVVLAPIGAPGVIVKGAIAPTADRDGDGQPEPDFDTYLLEVAGPTLLGITVDGIGGLAGGVLVVGEPAGLAGWSRLGVNLTGDTARRHVYLPAAGRYLLALADTRSLLFGTPVGDAGTHYYATLTQLTIPAPTPLVATAGVLSAEGSLAAEATQVYAAPLGTGTSTLTLATDHPSQLGALVVIVDGEVRGEAAERKPELGATPAQVTLAGVGPGASTLIVLEPQRAATVGPVPFVLDGTTANLP